MPYVLNASGRQVVKYVNPMTARQELIAKIRADEASAPGDEIANARAPLRAEVDASGRSSQRLPTNKTRYPIPVDWRKGRSRMANASATDPRSALYAGLEGGLQPPWFARMTVSVEQVSAAVIAAALAGAATPTAIRVARRTAFFDQPVGYKGHASPTPYLGGAAVLASFLVAAVAFSGALDRLWPILAVGLALCVIGTVDDRIALAPRWRLLAEAGAALALWDAGLGWSLPGLGILNLVLTLAWVVGLVNAFNLMDNLDGATATVSLVSALGAGGLALLHHDAGLAVLAFALAGACAGFLPYNLARPARIFLGDGGSMLLGFLVAAVVMNAVDTGQLRGVALLAGALVAGLPILDTTLVVVSRRRRGIPLVTGGRDHLTHRLLARLGSTRRVAAALALGQAALSASAIVGHSGGRVTIGILAGAWTLAGIAALFVLESPGWRPPPAASRSAISTTPPRHEPDGSVPRKPPAQDGDWAEPDELETTLVSSGRRHSRGPRAG